MENLNRSFPPLPKSLENGKKLFEGIRFSVYGIEKTVGGKTYQRQAVVHPGAVVILPLLNDKTVLMIQNYRFAVGESLWELPAGTLEPDEDPKQTATRELIEETGYQSENIQFLTHFFTSPGICSEKMHAYLATDLTFVGQHLEETEEITVHPFSWNQVMGMIKEGNIKDGKTLATLLYYRSFL